MCRRMGKKLFAAGFLLLITVPLLTTSLRKNMVSDAERRVLAQFPELYCEDGSRNGNFNAEFETWFGDHVGLRSHMVVTNARIQYYLFRVLANNSNMYLGPEGEFNYATADMLVDYQHLNLKTEETLDRLAEGFRYADEYLKEKGIQMYYFQCWDKHSVYPEYFPDTVIQYGEKSKTDQIVETLTERTDVCVISSKEKLTEGKAEWETYSRWGDSTHWTQRGAYIGYCMLMDELNKRNDGRYRVLREQDYNISVRDMGVTLFGGIHKKCMLEQFEIRNPQAYLTNEKLTLLREDERHRFFTNDNAGNDTRVLILGDSYFDSFILDDLAESFYETLIIWGDYADEFEAMIEEYAPDILIVENAERCDRSGRFARAALAVRDAGEK